MFKKITFIFIIISTIAFSQQEIINANGNAMVIYDNSSGRITGFYDDMCLRKQSLRDVDLGIVVNSKIVTLKEMNPKVNYLKGTGIVEISADYDKIHLNVKIFTPIETKERTLSIIYEVSTMEMKDLTDVKGYYYINSVYTESQVDFDERTGIYKENDIKIRPIKNKLTMYISDDENIKSLKFRKINETEKKKTEEKVVGFIEIGKVESYDKKNNGIILTMEQNESVNVDDCKIIIDNEIDNWNYINRTLNLDGFTAREKETLVQNIIFLKMMQKKSGAILSGIGIIKEYEIKTEDMLNSAIAFIRTENFVEAKAIIDFILKRDHIMQEKIIGGKYSIASYGYDCVTEGEKILKTNEGEVVSIYNSALFLFVLSEYMNKTGDYTLLKDNYKRLTETISDLVFRNINSGIVDKDSGNREIGVDVARSFLNTQYMVYLGLSKFAQEIKFFAPKGLVDKYLEAAESIRVRTEAAYVKKDGIISDIYGEDGIDIRSIEAINKEFFNDKKAIDITINELFFNYKVNAGVGFGEVKNSDTEKMAVNLDAVSMLYKNGYKYRAEEINEKIEGYMIENYNIIPYEVKFVDDKGVPSFRGLSSEISSKYIINVMEKYRN